MAEQRYTTEAIIHKLREAPMHGRHYAFYRRPTVRSAVYEIAHEY